MDDQAWPFLIGRTRTQDHRMVVIPDFMTGALASALRIAVGSGAPGTPESVQIREIQAYPDDRVTVIYRVTRAHADTWGLPGERTLTDEQGRPIVLTEGLVIRRPATAVRQDGITQEDLDLAHSLVVPAYLEFWAQGGDYARQAAKPFRLAMSGEPVAVSPLESAIPRVSPRPEATQPPEAAAPPETEPPEGTTTGADTHAAAGTDALVPVVSGERRPRKRMATATAIGVAIAVITIAVLLAIRLLQGPGPSAPASGPASTMAALCNALQSGDPARSYATTTSTYQRETTEQEFATELLPLGKTAAIQCSYHLQANPGPATASATMTVTEGHKARHWQVTLIKADGSTWQVSTIHLPCTMPSHDAGDPARLRPIEFAGSRSALATSVLGPHADMSILHASTLPVRRDCEPRRVSDRASHALFARDVWAQSPAATLADQARNCGRTCTELCALTTLTLAGRRDLPWPWLTTQSPSSATRESTAKVTPIPPGKETRTQLGC
jgi:hypothetical protein